MLPPVFSCVVKKLIVLQSLLIIFLGRAAAALEGIEAKVREARPSNTQLTVQYQRISISLKVFLRSIMHKADNSTFAVDNNEASAHGHYLVAIEYVVRINLSILRFNCQSAAYLSGSKRSLCERDP
jgi:hypothetical protein